MPNPLTLKDLAEVAETHPSRVGVIPVLPLSLAALSRLLNGYPELEPVLLKGSVSPIYTLPDEPVTALVTTVTGLEPTEVVKIPAGDAVAVVVKALEISFPTPDQGKENPPPPAP